MYRIMVVIKIIFGSDTIWWTFFTRRKYLDALLRHFLPLRKVFATKIAESLCNLMLQT